LALIWPSHLIDESVTGGAAVPYSDIKNAIKIDKDFSNQDKNAILGVIKEAYEKSSIARTMFNEWVKEQGRDINFIYEEGNFAAGLGTGKLFLDMRELDDASYIDNRGNAVRDFPFTAIIHELGHALVGLKDNWTSVAPAGDNQLFANKIYEQAGYTKQLAYMAYDASGEIIQRGVDYTEGLRIDSAWVMKWDDLPSDYDTTNGGTFNKAYRDLVIGDGRDNILKTGNGRDFIFGLGGDDQLFGGKDIDQLNGGAGGDVLNGGDAFDYASYRLATTGVTADLDDNTNNTNDADGDQYVDIEGLIGSEKNDSLAGNDSFNKIEGRGGKDDLTGSGGDDELDGGKGIDTAHYEFDFDQYTFSKSQGTISNGSEGVDHLKKVEFALFADGTLNLTTGDFTPSEARFAADYLV
jgi:Ca2+-binding RTX toxin-like protein